MNRTMECYELYKWLHTDDFLKPKLNQNINKRVEQETKKTQNYSVPNLVHLSLIRKYLIY